MGAKKKSKANRFAKMSDEERARYLQHRADIEEEARRRKEQLISTFLKNKIKKEEAFARLNIAKINQHWHQILRKAKCKEMKDNVQHLKEWIDRTVALKNRTINLLIEELDEAEDQYANNFQAHMIHIDDIISKHNVYFKKLQDQYEEDRDLLLETAAEEEETIRRKAMGELQHLQTVKYGQDVEFKRKQKDSHETNIKKQNEAISNYRCEFEAMKKRLEAISNEIWKQISDVIKSYVQQTDKRRMHMAELVRLDAEGTAEIKANQERLFLEEEKLTTLKSEHELLVIKREEMISVLESNFKKVNQDFIDVRKQLRSDLAKDRKQLSFLTVKSNETIQYLKRFVKKGEQLLYLVQECRKYETENEKIARWMMPFNDTDEETEAKPEDGPNTAESKTRVESKLPKEKIDSISVDVSTSTKRPKTSKPKMNQLANQSTLKDVSFSFEDDQKVDAKIGFVEGFESLYKLEGFWLVFNKAELDYLELMEEKKILIDENKCLRGMMRSILEAAALSKAAPDTSVSTRICSRSYRDVQSAPIKLL